MRNCVSGKVGTREPAPALGRRALGNNGNNCRRPSERFESIARQLQHDVLCGRADKYMLRTGVQYLLYQYDAARPRRDRLFRNVRLCGTSLRSDELSAAIERDGKIYQSNIAHCDSVWLCPTCATAIQTKRAQTVSDLIAVSNAMGYRVGMITYTAHHSRSDSLDDIVSNFYKAYRSVQKTRLTRKIRQTADFVGVVRVAEVNWSPLNGWHWHYHVLVIFKGYFDALAMKRQWLSALERCGFVNDDEARANAARHAFRFDLMRKGGDEKSLARYINKMSFELSYSAGKKGHTESLTPWDLAARAFVANTEQDRKMYRSLFLEYAKTTKGRKQLTMTPGLRKKFGFEEQAGIDENAVQFAEIKWGLTYEHVLAMKKANKIRVYMQEIAPRALDEIARVGADADGRVAPPRAVVSFFRRLGCKTAVADNLQAWESHQRYLVKLREMRSGETKRRAEIARLGRSAIELSEQHDKYAECQYSDYLHARHAGASASLLGDLLRKLPLKSDKNAMLSLRNLE